MIQELIFFKDGRYFFLILFFILPQLRSRIDSPTKLIMRGLYLNYQIYLIEHDMGIYSAVDVFCTISVLASIFSLLGAPPRIRETGFPLTNNTVTPILSFNCHDYYLHAVQALGTHCNRIEGAFIAAYKRRGAIS